MRLRYAPSRHAGSAVLFGAASLCAAWVSGAVGPGGGPGQAAARSASQDVLGEPALGAGALSDRFSAESLSADRLSAENLTEDGGLEDATRGLKAKADPAAAREAVGAFETGPRADGDATRYVAWAAVGALEQTGEAEAGAAERAAAGAMVIWEKQPDAAAARRGAVTLTSLRDAIAVEAEVVGALPADETLDLLVSPAVAAALQAPGDEPFLVLIEPADGAAAPSSETR